MPTSHGRRRLTASPPTAAATLDATSARPPTSAPSAHCAEAPLWGSGLSPVGTLRSITRRATMTSVTGSARATVRRHPMALP